MMFSLESILEITGQARWADYLERVAYNALPTQHTDDFNGRQYYQQTNQVAATLAWRQFSTVNGKPVQLNVNENGIAIVEGSWNNGDQLVLSLPMTLQGSQWYCGGGVIERGPLLYALRLDEQWQRKSFGERRGFGTHYDEVTTASSWNYGLPHRAIEHPADYFTVEVHEPTAGCYPWNTANAPIILKGKGLRMNDWKEVRGCASPISYFTQQGHDWNGEDDITLIPYGCTTLRIALFPIR